MIRVEDCWRRAIQWNGNTRTFEWRLVFTSCKCSEKIPNTMDAVGRASTTAGCTNASSPWSSVMRRQEDDEKHQHNVKWMIMHENVMIKEWEGKGTCWGKSRQFGLSTIAAIGQLLRRTGCGWQRKRHISPFPLLQYPTLFLLSLPSRDSQIVRKDLA